MDKTTFDSFLVQEAHFYGQTLAAVLKNLTEFSPTSIEVGRPESTLRIGQSNIATVPFMGSVAGEFILSIPAETLKRMLPRVTQPGEAESIMTESLNMASGASLARLSEQYEQLTLTPPRFFFGSATYPNLRNIEIRIEGNQGTVHAYLFIDLMKLDIAESYHRLISELTQSNNQLSIANKKLMEHQAQLIHSEKMACLGMMAAGVAHEINNPLAFVASNSEVLNSYVDAMRRLLVGYDQLLTLVGRGRSDLAKIELTKISEIKQKEDIGFILEDTRKLLAESKYGLERIRTIVHGLKRFSRIGEAEYKQVSINSELNDTLMLLQTELKYRCRVETEFLSEREIECMPGELSQVFVNIIMNAAQAIHDPEGKIRVRTWDTSTGIGVEISDTGEGISPENQKKLFSPFFTTKAVGEGTGLGLAISHGIIQDHGGSITATSQLGVGTTFRIELPAQIPSELKEKRLPKNSGK
jgi:two-component system NtrC family sensor kinase